VQAAVTTGDRTGVPVGTLLGTVGRAKAGAAIGVVAPGLPPVTHLPGVTGRRSVGHCWVSRSLSTRGDNLVYTVIEWHSYRLDNKN